MATKSYTVEVVGADSRLIDVKRLGGARDMLAFRDGDEDPELFERHRPALSGQDRPRLHEDRREGSLQVEPFRGVAPASGCFDQRGRVTR